MSKMSEERQFRRIAGTRSRPSKQGRIYGIQETEKRESRPISTAPLASAIAHVPFAGAQASLLNRVASGSSSTNQSLLQLQRQHGNRHVQQVVALARASNRNQVAPQGNPLIQGKLAVGQPGDQYEQEADLVSAEVVNQMNAPQSVQRQTMAEEEENLAQMKPMVQRQFGREGMADMPDLEASIQQARSGGQPLDENIRKPIEQAFGADFGDVRIHANSQADTLNRSLQARAFTTGQDVFFRQGEYTPRSQQGQELLAHELTHVVQQGATSIQAPPFFLKTLSQQQKSVPNLQKEEAAPTVLSPPEVVPAQRMNQQEALEWLRENSISYTRISAGSVEFSPAIRVDFSQVVEGFQLYNSRGNPSNIHPVTPRLAVALVRLIRFLSHDGVTILHHLGVSVGTHAEEGYCIDIAGFTFSDGTRILLDRDRARSAFYDTTTTVPTGHNAREYMLRVGTWMADQDFGQVIGPGIGRGGHYDHFHAQVRRGRTYQGFVYQESTP